MTKEQYAEYLETALADKRPANRLSDLIPTWFSSVETNMEKRIYFAAVAITRLGLWAN